MRANHRFLLKMCLDLCPRGRILDYGCGAGEIVQRGRDVGLDLHGVDAFYDAADRQHTAHSQGMLGTAVRRMENHRIPHADDSFDLVISNQVFEHVDDLSAALTEIRRVLRPDGRMLSLFPTSQVIREGHCGVPLAHWWRSPRAQYWWLRGFRALGFGYHRAGKSPHAWASDFVTYLERFTSYRSPVEIARTAREHFEHVAGIETDYVAYRLREKQCFRLATWCESRPLRTWSRTFCRRWGGEVMLASRPIKVAHPDDPRATETSPPLPRFERARLAEALSLPARIDRMPIRPRQSAEPSRPAN